MRGLISSAERRMGQSSDLANMTLSGARKPPADLGLGRTQVDKIKGMCHRLSGKPWSSYLMASVCLSFLICKIERVDTFTSIEWLS